MEDTKLKVDIFYNHAGFPVVGLDIKQPQNL